MGTLVKTAQMVEDQVVAVRKEFEPRVRSKWQEARAEWVELRSRRGSYRSQAEGRLRAFLIRTDSRVRTEGIKLIERMIAELEKLKRSLPRQR